ncbi:MAG: APC family permease [Desulfovermiculus sp.]
MKKLSSAGDLVRQVGPFSATVLVISNMVGTGVFTTSGLIMQELQDPLVMLLCWMCGGIFALCGALCYGEMGARFPRAGGEYVFLRESFGRMAGFLSGWISLIVGFSAPIAAAAVAFATYLFSAFGLETEGKMPIEFFGVQVVLLSPVNLTALVTIIVFSLLHFHSVGMGSRIQNLLTVSNFLLILIFVGAGFLFGAGSAAHFEQSLNPSAFSPQAFAVSLIFVSFAYSGWNAAAYLGEEIRNPGRNIPLALIVGTLLVAGLYLLLNAVFVYSMPAEHMEGLIDVGAKSARLLFGATAGRLLSLAVALGILSAVSAMIMTGPRIYYAMSRDGVFFTRLAKLDAERRTPACSIALQGGIACVMVLTAAFDALLVYIGFTLSIFAMLTVVGMMYIRRIHPDIAAKFRTPAYPLPPLLFISGNVWIVWYMIQSRPVSALFGLGTIVVGSLIYLGLVCQRAFRIPLFAGKSFRQTSERPSAD